MSLVALDKPDKKVGELIAYTDQKEYIHLLTTSKGGYSSITTEGKLSLVPKHEAKGDYRMVMTMYGRSGTGKSTLAAKTASNYEKVMPGRMIYLITTKKDSEDNEKTFGHLKNLQQLDYEQPFNLIDFKKSLVIFDDIEGEKQNKDIYNNMVNLMNEI